MTSEPLRALGPAPHLPLSRGGRPAAAPDRGISQCPRGGAKCGTLSVARARGQVPDAQPGPLLGQRQAQAAAHPCERFFIRSSRLERCGRERHAGTHSCLCAKMARRAVLWPLGGRSLKAGACWPHRVATVPASPRPELLSQSRELLRDACCPRGGEAVETGRRSHVMLDSPRLGFRGTADTTEQGARKHSVSEGQVWAKPQLLKYVHSCLSWT